jgi:hypothetical protein
VNWPLSAELLTLAAEAAAVAALGFPSLKPPPPIITGNFFSIYLQGRRGKRKKGRVCEYSYLHSPWRRRRRSCESSGATFTGFLNLTSAVAAIGFAVVTAAAIGVAFVAAISN